MGITASIITALGTVFSVSKAAEAQTDARNAAKRAADRERLRLQETQEAADAAAAKAEADAAAAETEALDEAEKKRRERLRRSSESGRASTFLSSPLDTPAPSNVQRKTLLGS